MSVHTIQPADIEAIMGEPVSERLKKRQSIYARVFDALVALVEADRNPEALKALLQEPEDNPDDRSARPRLGGRTGDVRSG